jgi:hypothetical protein
METERTVQHGVDEAIHRRFEASRLARQTEPIEHFLPPRVHPLYLGTLVELVHIELDCVKKE